MWSIGNEEGWIQTTSYGKRIAQTLIAKQKEFDPTRTCTYAADVANVFHGVNEVIPVRGFNYREKFAAADYHRDHPDQPIMGTEMGSTVTTRGIYVKDTIRAYVPDQDITPPWWASTAETWWKLVRQMISGWVVLYGQVLIIAVNQLLINGQISIRILVSWICVAFQKIFIITINRGGQIKMYCIFLRIGTGGTKKESRLMFG